MATERRRKCTLCGSTFVIGLPRNKRHASVVCPETGCKLVFWHAAKSSGGPIRCGVRPEIAENHQTLEAVQ